MSQTKHLKIYPTIFKFAISTSSWTSVANLDFLGVYNYITIKFFFVNFRPKRNNVMVQDSRESEETKMK